MQFRPRAISASPGPVRIRILGYSRQLARLTDFGQKRSCDTAAILVIGNL